MSDQNLVIALQKCEFFKKEAKFLGFLITENGIRADDMKVKALLDLDYPRNQKEGQRFIGSLNYYSRLIPKMSALLEPLTKEIGKGKEFQLNETITKGIDELKEEIKKGVSVDHLRYPSEGDPDSLFLAADTSLTRTGCIIGNLTKNEDVITNITVAGYASRALDKQEQLLSSRARELIGLGHCLKAFEDLIPKDRPFMLLCDHKSLEGAKHLCKLKTSENSDKQTPITNSPLDVQNLRTNIRRKDSENEEDKAYNLRSRKKINYKM
ncbi:Oidioi.mRNA.OKI2018_I69.chr2.g4828.t1.cds [Oikopleura dioica]|uniref:Oidioi.mRNA.OKI2018_I69.chr2.g4828.t1.cds n=1 Tax=Oikopleura dioica TaxID=34765 RepID=A0ABN7T2A0_OIKDI|nr:Oidioi.mRNA.OKI2018_I69.chr2.g4828.t1.cds [Oikopleura dioica]